jgi:NADH dehydrogenase
MSDQSMTVAVTGATGFVGRHVVRELLAHGHAVRALVRTPSKATRAFEDAANRDKLTLVQAETVTEDSASRLVEGADACVNCIGIIREEQGQRFDFLHVRVPELLSKACRSHGVDRYVQISALGADPDGRAEYQRSKYAGEKAVRRSGLDWTIFRPSLVLGEGGEMGGLLAQWARGKSQPWFFMPYFTRRADGQWSLIPGETTDPIIAPIGVHDLAKAVRLALGNDESVGEVYNAVGSEAVSWPEMLRTARDATPGAKKTIQPGGIPAPAAALAAMKMKFFGMGNLLPFDAGMAAMGAEDSTASLEKFEAHFGFVPGSYEGALREAVASA